MDPTQQPTNSSSRPTSIPQMSKAGTKGLQGKINNHQGLNIPIPIPPNIPIPSNIPIDPDVVTRDDKCVSGSKDSKTKGLPEETVPRGSTSRNQGRPKPSALSRMPKLCLAPWRGPWRLRSLEGSSGTSSEELLKPDPEPGTRPWREIRERLIS